MAPRKREPPPLEPPAAAGEEAPPEEEAPVAARRVVTWPREGLPAGGGYLVAPAGPPGSGRPEVRIAVPEDPAGEAEALGRALQDPALAAAVGPRAAFEDTIPAEEVFRELDAADAAGARRPAPGGGCSCACRRACTPPWWPGPGPRG